MTIQNLSIRRAKVADAPILAKLVNYAGEGMPEYLWTRMADAGEDIWEIGTSRQALKVEKDDIFVIEDGEVRAGLTGYAIPAEPEPVSDNIPAMFRPLLELENLAPSTWYVNVLATLPEHRGMGYGTKLLKLAESEAKSQRLTAMSLIVANKNDGAKKLYKRNGYEEVAERPIVKEDWQNRSDKWVLMTKKLQA